MTISKAELRAEIERLSVSAPVTVLKTPRKRVKKTARANGAAPARGWIYAK